MAGPLLPGQDLDALVRPRLGLTLPDLLAECERIVAPQAAERSLRPLVIARKISDGSRSAAGSTTTLVLASLVGTWRARGLNPFFQIQSLRDFNQKFGPEWVPRSVVIDEVSDLPRIAMLYASVEGFLELPVLSRALEPP